MIHLGQSRDTLVVDDYKIVDRANSGVRGGHGDERRWTIRDVRCAL